MWLKDLGKLKEFRFLPLFKSPGELLWNIWRHLRMSISFIHSSPSPFNGF